MQPDRHRHIAMRYDTRHAYPWDGQMTGDVSHI